MRAFALLAAVLAFSCAKKGGSEPAPPPAPMAPAVARPLAAGDPVPTVALESHDGRRVSLADFKGKKILVWFYPKAGTSG